MELTDAVVDAFLDTVQADHARSERIRRLFNERRGVMPRSYMQLRREMGTTNDAREEFDATDSNAGEKVAEAGTRLMHAAARAIEAENAGMRLGRDDAGRLGVAILDFASSVGIVERSPDGKTADKLWRLLEVTHHGEVSTEARRTQSGERVTEATTGDTTAGDGRRGD